MNTKASPSVIIGDQIKKENDGFSKWCPVGKKSEISKDFPFAGICGADSVCRSDVRLSCQLPQFRFVLLITFILLLEYLVFIRHYILRLTIIHYILYIVV